MHIRPPHVAGSFYDAQAETLATYVKHTLQQAQDAYDQAPQEVSMVMLPHAGHFYCGHIIAQTLARVRLQKRLIILCPNHTGQGAPLSVWCPQTQPPHSTLGAWQTPLGTVPIDEELTQKILEYDIWTHAPQRPAQTVSFTANTLAHAREHSIEVLLPFLQFWLPQCSIVPIAVGTRDFSLLQRAGLALGEILSDHEDVSIILSSDMHHFSDHHTTLALDTLALEAMLAFDPVRLAQVVQEHAISMCGVCPAILALYACKVLGATVCSQVSHTTSYEKGGDASKVVGYASLIVQKRTC